VIPITIPHTLFFTAAPVVYAVPMDGVPNDDDDVLAISVELEL